MQVNKILNFRQIIFYLTLALFQKTLYYSPLMFSDIYRFCAYTGSGLFAIQLVLAFLGANDDDFEGGYHFKWLSKQAIAGFLMMFGWVGLTCINELGFTTLFATFIATLAGLIATLIISLIFHLASKLRSSGTVFRIDEAIGKEASVYQRIPKGGAGKISLALSDLTHEIDAISNDGEEIDSFTKVKIINKADHRTVIVTR